MADTVVFYEHEGEVYFACDGEAFTEDVLKALRYSPRRAEEVARDLAERYPQWAFEVGVVG